MKKALICIIALILIAASVFAVCYLCVDSVNEWTRELISRL